MIRRGNTTRKQERMSSSPETTSMALFCDFENVALGVRDAKYDKFDIKRVLERLLLKGSIVVKKAYCDWERYRTFKATMHEASFELIEIPHVRQSGKNSADIRLVVDALDLCYTKSHVNTFVIISGDSDFSPLVSKLRENNKQVIGVGVKQSTSDLLIANCDEFIFYDDLVRESQRAQQAQAPRGGSEAPAAAKRSPEDDRRRREDSDRRKGKAIDLAMETFEALVSERGSGKIWASVLKDAIKRRKPDFSESYYGFRTFGGLLEEAQSRGLLEIGRDDKSNTFIHRPNGAPVSAPAARQEPAPDAQPTDEEVTAALMSRRASPAEGEAEPRQRSRGGRGSRKTAAQRQPATGPADTAAPPAALPEPPPTEPQPEPAPVAEVVEPVEPASAPAKKRARKTASSTAPRSRRPRATKAAPSDDA
jgi:uncharacterized LabA/DUF88 family protein